MSQHALTVALVLAAMVMVSFWRQLVRLLLALLMAVFILGLYETIEIMQRR